ncbi:hypothetical protein ACWGNU_12060 [Paenibacillus lautus]
MSAYYDDRYNENETVSSGYALGWGPDYIPRGQEGVEPAHDALNSDKAERSKRTLWEDEPSGESWMNGWNGREETHAMFRQSYE